MRLAVNIDHIATLREARKAREPEPVAAALAAEMAGAQGITVHLRSDRRHIKERDLELLRQAIATRLNVEMAVTADMARVALQVRPYQVTLVPERPQELTTEGGLDVVANASAVKDFTSQMHDAGIRVSVFLDRATPIRLRAADGSGRRCRGDQYRPIRGRDGETPDAGTRRASRTRRAWPRATISRCSLAMV